MSFQKPKIIVVMMATFLSLGLLSSMPLNVFASHSYEAGVLGDSIPDNTHVNLNGVTLPPGGVLPVYDASPNFVSGHFLFRGPCTDDGVPFVSAIGGHIDEHNLNTHVDFLPLYVIDAASTPADPQTDRPRSCVWHSHVPDPLNGGSPRITDIDLVNYGSEDVTFNAGDVVDINIQRSLGAIADYYEVNDLQQLPGDLAGGNNVVFNWNDDNPNNDGIGGSRRLIPYFFLVTNQFIFFIVSERNIIIFNLLWTGYKFF